MYWRMRDFDVLHPMGWDSFGLPAEQHAINTGTHPAVTTGENIANFKRQLKSLGFSYDYWERELATTDEGYVKWTQWIFVQLFKRNLAVQSEVQVNWCPKLGTVLANEEVIDGLSERGSFPVERRPLRQWVLKITEYAERLAEELDGLQWPEGTMRMQRADRQVDGRRALLLAIAPRRRCAAACRASPRRRAARRSAAPTAARPPAARPPPPARRQTATRARPPRAGGAAAIDEEISVFTTRPDTLMGVAYVVLAPEHPLVERIVARRSRVGGGRPVREGGGEQVGPRPHRGEAEERRGDRRLRRPPR